jgi:IS30 family transposase
MEEREKILVLHTEKRSLRSISVELGRSASTISRELKRNTTANKSYLAIVAEQKYQRRRKKFRRHKLLEIQELKNIVIKLFLEQQWSLEEIANRLKHEGRRYRISYSTIYRAIYAGMLDVEKLSHGNRGVIRKL